MKKILFIAAFLVAFIAPVVLKAQWLMSSPPTQAEVLGKRSFDLSGIDYSLLDSVPVLAFNSKRPATQFKAPLLNHLPGLFCKLEYKIELKSKLAPRFRLGSLQYTEWMEGKQFYYP